MTLLELLDRTPPIRCRFMARRGRKPLSNHDIALASGLSRSTINELSHLRSWKGVKVGTIEAFCSACGVNILAPSRRRDRRLVKAGKLAFIRQSTPAQRKMYDRILRDMTRPSYRDLESGPRDSRGLLE